jgi:hypothetical protein
MELADLVLQVQPLDHSLVLHQIICHDDNYSRPLYQWHHQRCTATGLCSFTYPTATGCPSPKSTATRTRRFSPHPNTYTPSSHSTLTGFHSLCRQSLSSSSYASRYRSSRISGYLNHSKWCSPFDILFVFPQQKIDHFNDLLSCQVSGYIIFPVGRPQPPNSYNKAKIYLPLFDGVKISILASHY